MHNLYIYKAKLSRVVDGDSVNLWVDLGFTVWVEQKFRLIGVNTPELNSSDPEERLRAFEAKNYVIEELSRADEILVESHKTEKYGRYLADITYRIDDSWYNLVQGLLTAEHGVPYSK